MLKEEVIKEKTQRLWTRDFSTIRKIDRELPRWSEVKVSSKD